MLTRILNSALGNRGMVLFLAAVLTGLGFYLSRTMNVDVFPDLTAPTVTVMTEAHGLESVEVEKLVTYPLETALNGSPGVRRIRSTSAAGVSIIYVEFEWGMDIYLARQIVNERLVDTREKLPEGVSTPAMTPISSIMGEIMLLGVTSDSLSPMDLRILADWAIAPELKSVNGVANIVVLGGEFKQYQVLAHPEKLKYFGVGIDDLLDKVREANVSVTGGVIEQYGNYFVIKGNGRVHQLRDLEEAVIRNVYGQSIKIKDVASVRIGSSDKIGDGSLNAGSAVIMTITKQPEVNTLALTRELDAAIASLQERMPESVVLHNRIFRQADFIDASVRNLRLTLLEGAFFVIVILFVFLMNWRTTVISLLAIPISLLVSIIVLKALGYTINTMSLGGMAIAIGTLVDDAVIDVENVYKRLRQNIALPESERKGIIEVVRDASLEIRSSIIFATLIIIVSFVPLFFLSGMEGRLLRPLGIAFITSVLTSLAVAITVTPVLCSYLLSKRETLERNAEGTAVERFLQRGYGWVLDGTLRFPVLIISISVIVLAASLYLFSSMGRSFLPEFNEGSLVVSVVGPPGMSLEESNKIGKMSEELLLELPEVDVVTRRTGRAELDEHAQGVNSSEIDVPFELKGRSREDFFAAVREKLSVVPGVNVIVGQPIAHRIDHMLSGTRANIAVKIFGPDLNMLFEIGKDVESTMRGLEGLADVSLDQQVEVPQVSIKPNRRMLSAYGLTVGELLHQVEIAFSGEKAGEINEGQQYYDLVVRYDEPFRDKIEKLDQALISLPDGGFITLDQLATITSVSSPYSISREDVNRKIVVAANVEGTDLRSAVNSIKDAVAIQTELPEGYKIEYGGQFESEARATQLLLITAVLAIVVIFILLFMEFGNLTLASVVLLNLPLALIGGGFAIFLSTGVISIASTIGLISLFGIATRNGILLVSRYEDLRREGVTGMELLHRGAIDRLNPILMTAFTTGLALVPLALKGGEPGNEIQSPMAVVILGGLLSATVLNLLVIPAVYGLVRARKKSRN